MRQKILWVVISWTWLIFLAAAWSPTAAATPTPTVSPSPTPASVQPTPALNFRVTPRQAEPNQTVMVQMEGLPADVVSGRAEACLVLHDVQGQARDSWRLLAETDQTQEIKIRESVVPDDYQLAVEICALIGENVVNANPQIEPLATLPFTVKPRSGQFDQIKLTLSPDGQWTAIVNTTAGSLTLADRRNNQTEIFPEGSTMQQVVWAPDSRRLLAVRSNWRRIEGQSALSATGPIELWRLDLDLQNSAASTPTLLYKPAESDYANNIAPPPQQVVFGKWSPNNRHLLFGVSLLSASILADGIPPLVLDTDTGQVYPVARESLPEGTSPLDLSSDNTALANPRYHSWSPDGSKLAITAGGYRSAQVNKWLNLFEVATGQVMTVISQSEQIPGAVTWSPRGDLIAYAAVPAEQTGPEWADLMTFDNPAIAGRRIYLLDPATGQYHRLNQMETYQDAPVWSNDGARLYYVQRNSEVLNLMVADPVSGQARPVPGASQPVDLKDPLRPNVGYYGQFGREELLEQIPESPLGATATGRVILGFGKHLPVGDLPLWVGNEPDEEIKRRTAADGTFTLTGLQPGLIRVRNSHLEFEVPVTTLTETLDLGLLKYPLIHPPDYYYWTAAPLPEQSSLLDQGQVIEFEVCHTEPTWQHLIRPVQQATVWSKRPFSERSQEWLNWWFSRPAVLYTGEDQFEQSYPDGPNLDSLIAGWRYLLGLWTDNNLKFVTNDAGLMAPQIACSYNSQDLEDLLNRRQLEVWLPGYRATEVRRLDKEAIDYSEAALCNPQESTCTERPGHHFAVRVTPSSGYQIIRFAGVEDVLAVHLIDEDGQELLELPQPQPERWQVQDNWTDLPYEVCFSSQTWQRPSDEALERFVKGDPRYSVEMIKTSPLWTDNFLLYPDGASGHAMLFNLGGFWTVAGDITQKQTGLCQERERDVSTGKQVEVWLKYHRLLQLQYSDQQIRFVVQSDNRGFQAIDFLRPEPDDLHFIFVTPDGQEITRFSNRPAVSGSP